MLFDTHTHLIYLKKLFNLKGSHFKTLYLGADNKILYPKEVQREDKKFIVGFYGTYIPLQGIKYIYDAAKILEKYKEIEFEVIGGTEDNKYYKSMLRYFRTKETRNDKLIPRVPLKELPDNITRSDIQLGIFGDTIKANLVIPNKVYTSIAMNKAIITSNTPAIKEVFENEKNILLCKRADSKSLAISRSNNIPRLG